MSNSQFMSHSAEASRISELDAMRGIGILAVFAWHGWWIYPTAPWIEQIQAFMPVLRVSIDMFFVLSGYLITAILLRTRESPGYFKRFYLRRVLRILPAYYAALLLIFVVMPAFDPLVRDSSIREYAPWYVLHGQNWLFALVQPDLKYPATDHFWSLAVEEQYYLCWPLIVWLVPREALGRMCLILFVLSVAAKFLLVALHADWQLIYMGTLTRVDAVVAGGWIATLRREQARELARPAWALAVVSFTAMMAVIATRPIYNALSTATVTTIASFYFGALTLLIHAGTTGVLKPFLTNRVFVWLGSYSYGIYLLHYPAILWVRGMVVRHPWLLPMERGNLKSFVLALIALALSIVLALLLYRLIEKPALDLRLRFVPEAEKAPRAESTPAAPRGVGADA